MKLECNPAYANFPYNGSNIRTYVDINFRNSFSEEEKNRIIYPTTIIEYGSTLYEHIFLLSVAEAKKYFKNDNDRVAKYESKPFLWWLRSNGGDSSKMACVYGEIQAIDSNIIGGIRPALWLNLGKKHK